MTRLAERRVVVTGGGSGIGRACAERCAADGARVLVADVREHLAEETADAIGEAAVATRCDVTEEDDVRRSIELAAETFGGIDGLVTSAGIATAGLVRELAIEDWELVLRVNLTGTFLAVKHALPHLERDGGAVVTIGSVSSVVLGAGGAAASYAASKGGVLQLTKAVAVEGAGHGIRANCVCPGAIATNLRRHVAELSGDLVTQDPTARTGITVTPPDARRADPAEVASVVAFLLSDDASFMTGSAVMVDGGYTAI